MRPAGAVSHSGVVQRAVGLKSWLMRRARSVGGGSERASSLRALSK